MVGSVELLKIHRAVAPLLRVPGNPSILSKALIEPIDSEKGNVVAPLNFVKSINICILELAKFLLPPLNEYPLGAKNWYETKKAGTYEIKLGCVKMI